MSMARLWKVGLGANGEFEKDATDRNLLTVGFGITQDIRTVKDRETLIALMDELHPNQKPKTRMNYAAQVNQFINVIKAGDIVVCPMKILGSFWIGKIEGDYAPHPETGRATRTVAWLRTNVPRDAIKQDLRYSFGAFMTICEITRNNALQRIQAVIKTGTDPGDGTALVKSGAVAKPKEADEVDPESEAMVDLGQLAADQIEARVASSFAGHDLTRLVAAILEAQGMRARVSPAGPDNGIDIVAGGGPLGFDSPRIVVQVKSGNEAIDQPTLQGLIGTVSDTKADFGLMVSWGGFRQSVLKRTNELFFRVRFWGRKEIMENLFATYERLPEEIRAELPLRRTWTLVPDEEETL